MQSVSGLWIAQLFSIILAVTPKFIVTQRYSCKQLALSSDRRIIDLQHLLLKDVQIDVLFF